VIPPFKEVQIRKIVRTLRGGASQVSSLGNLMEKGGLLLSGISEGEVRWPGKRNVILPLAGLTQSEREGFGKAEVPNADGGKQRRNKSGWLSDAGERRQRKEN